MKFTKDGVNIVDLTDESEEALTKARAKGYTPVLDVTKDGKDVHYINADDMNLVKAAREKGYKPVSEFQNVEDIKSDIADKYKDKQSASFAAGAADGSTFGFADEALGAVRSMLPGGSSYKNERNAVRLQEEAATRAHPGYALAGSVLSGLATPGTAAKAGGSALKTVLGAMGTGAAQGALTGYGSSEEGAGLKDSAKGALQGLALGSLAGVVGRNKDVAHAAGEALDSVKQGVQSLEPASAAFKAAAKADDGALTHLPEWTGLPGLSRITKGSVAALKEKGATKEVAGELDDTINALRKTFGPGNATDLTNEDVLMQKLLEEGIVGEPNAAHRLVAAKFAQAHGGNAEQYLELLKRSPEELASARSFDAVKAGDDLLPMVKSAYEEAQKSSLAQYGKLKEAARSVFQKQGDAPLQTLNDAIKSSQKYKSISGGTTAVLDDVLSDLSGREGEIAFANLDPQEQFDRLLAAKQRLGKAVKWAAKNELPEGQEILSNTYNQFRKTLQQLDDMAAADHQYQSFKNIEKNLFKKLGTVERGRITEFDPIKIETLFSGSKSGRQLMAQVSKAREMLESGKLPKEQANNVKAMLDKIDELGNTSSLRRQINNFRYQDAGPSSPTIQRLQAIQGKDSAIANAVKAPQLFVNMKATAAETAKSLFKTPFSQLNEKQRQAVGKYALWASKNPEASAAEMQRAADTAIRESR
jgi:hypothetical protein